MHRALARQRALWLAALVAVVVLLASLFALAAHPLGLFQANTLASPSSGAPTAGPHPLTTPLGPRTVGHVTLTLTNLGTGASPAAAGPAFCCGSQSLAAISCGGSSPAYALVVEGEPELIIHDNQYNPASSNGRTALVDADPNRSPVLAQLKYSAVGYPTKFAQAGQITINGDAVSGSFDILFQLDNHQGQITWVRAVGSFRCSP